MSFFEDVLDNKLNVSREKLANCTFARLRPGDYVSASFGSSDEDGVYHCGDVFAKVISVKMPKPTGFFSGHTGGVLAELPDGSKVEFLRYYTGGAGRYQAYYPSGEVAQYFFNNCFPDPGWGGRVYMKVMAYTANERARLKDAMTAEQTRRKRRQEELNRQTLARQRADAEARQASRQRAAEEARRSAAVSDRELDSLFRGR